MAAKLAIIASLALGFATASQPLAHARELTACSEYIDCVSCLSEGGSTCRFCPSDNECHAYGSIFDPCSSGGEKPYHRFDDTCPTPTPSNAPDFLPDWMGNLKSVIGDLTLLDLSLPGTHDTLTYDLSLVPSDGCDDDSDVLSKILNEFSSVIPDAIEDFIRLNAQTQGLSITDQLNNGVRFIDFRTMYESKLDSWYALHFLQSNEPSLTYLQEVRTWMDNHPDEIVVMWVSRHGNGGATGTDQYPSTDIDKKTQYWGDMLAVFDGMVVDHSTTFVNETTISTMLERNHRVVFYTTDYAEFTDSSNYALDGKLVDNQLGSSVDDEESAIASERAAFQGSAATKALDKKERKLFLRSMATSSPGWQVEAMADITFNPFHGSDVAANCAKQFNIPNMTEWCPPTLEDIGQLANYYKQISLEEAYTNGWGFPNAIYIDGLDWDGTIRTGTQLLNGRERDSDHTTDAYAYADTLIAWNVRVACGDSTDGTCGELKTKLETRRAKHPVSRWDDAHYGRQASWP